jgi:8-oxo-dGTP diphosphatase
VDALIVRDGKLLLIKRLSDPYKGYWAFPGGHIEWNEEATETLQKEVMEETGLQVVSSELLNVYSKPMRDPQQKITVAYIVEAQGEPKAGSDAGELQWFDIKALPDMAFDHHTIFIDYLKKKNGSV